LDIGDFIGVRGTVLKRKWEKSRFMFMDWRFWQSLETASSSKTDADGKTYDAFADQNNYRRRYVDLTVNDHVKETFIKRTKLFNAMRSFFNDAGYLEVKHLFYSYSWWCCGATFYYTSQFAWYAFVRIANELYLKDWLLAVWWRVWIFEKLQEWRNGSYTTLNLLPWKYM
jgi:lysyl-tRNA synthetase class 2